MKIIITLVAALTLLLAPSAEADTIGRLTQGGVVVETGSTTDFFNLENETLLGTETDFVQNPGAFFADSDFIYFIDNTGVAGPSSQQSVLRFDAGADLSNINNGTVIATENAPPQGSQFVSPGTGPFGDDICLPCIVGAFSFLDSYYVVRDGPSAGGNASGAVFEFDDAADVLDFANGTFVGARSTLGDDTGFFATDDGIFTVNQDGRVFRHDSIADFVTAGTSIDVSGANNSGLRDDVGFYGFGTAAAVPEPGTLLLLGSGLLGLFATGRNRD